MAEDSPDKNNPEVMPSALAKVIKPNDIVVYISSAPELYSAHLHATKRVTSSHGAKLLILGGWPVLPMMPQVCLQKAELRQKLGQRSECWQAKAEADAQTSELRNQAKALLDENTVMLDLSSLICDSDGCDMWIPGTTLPGYLDRFHVNKPMAQYMARRLCEFLESTFSAGQLH